jgi:hypothetical protein
VRALGAERSGNGSASAREWERERASGSATRVAVAEPSGSRKLTVTTMGWPTSARTKVHVALFIESFLGTEGKTTGCRNRLSALWWRIGGGPLTGCNRLKQGRQPMSVGARSVTDALTVSGQPLFGSHRHSDRGVFSPRSRFGPSTGGWVGMSSRRARAHTARPQACARRQLSRRICRASSQSLRPRH